MKRAQLSEAIKSIVARKLKKLKEGVQADTGRDLANSLQKMFSSGEIFHKVTIQTHYGNEPLGIVEWWVHNDELFIGVENNQPKLQEGNAPKGYRVVSSPCKVVGSAPGQKWYGPRVWLNGQEILGINPGTAFESPEKAKSYGEMLAQHHASGKPLQELAPAVTSTGAKVTPTVNQEQPDQADQMTTAEKTQIQNSQKEQDKLTNDIRRIDGAKQKLLEPVQRKIQTLDRGKASKEKKLGVVTQKIAAIQRKYSKV